MLKPPPGACRQQASGVALWASPACTHLLAGHELEAAVGAKVQHGVGLEHLLQEGVVGGKAMVRRGGAAEQQAHRVALVAEGRLHANEHVAKLEEGGAGRHKRGAVVSGVLA